MADTTHDTDALLKELAYVKERLAAVEAQFSRQWRLTGRLSRMLSKEILSVIYDAHDIMEGERDATRAEKTWAYRLFNAD